MSKHWSEDLYGTMSYIGQNLIVKQKRKIRKRLNVELLSDGINIETNLNENLKFKRSRKKRY